MIKTQYLRSFGIVTFYYDRPFSIQSYKRTGDPEFPFAVDLFPEENEIEYRKDADRIARKNAAVRPPLNDNIVGSVT